MDIYHMMIINFPSLAGPRIQKLSDEILSISLVLAKWRKSRVVADTWGKIWPCQLVLSITTSSIYALDTRSIVGSHSPLMWTYHPCQERQISAGSPVVQIIKFNKIFDLKPVVLIISTDPFSLSHNSQDCKAWPFSKTFVVNSTLQHDC